MDRKMMEEEGFWEDFEIEDDFEAEEENIEE